jgi:cytochrome P450
VIKEGIRIWPPISTLQPKRVPVGGDTVDGTLLPAGTNIGVAVIAIQRSKQIFGDDAEEFRPERWLEIGEGEMEMARERRMLNTVDLIFSSGKWTCPGKSVAMIELNKVFVEVSDISSWKFLRC